uniref:Uncharacterized protein n=1 Tax=Acrobeloides nanus TaxID=290746 RepID=A0A914DPL8_9BILA
MVILGTLKEADMSADKIDEILLVGGSSRIAAIERLVLKIFPTKKLNFGLNPDEAIAYGATLRATQISQKGVTNIILNESNAKWLKNTSSTHTINPSLSIVLDEDRKMEQENIPNKIERHAIGRPAFIGSLYNATKDILYDEQLYTVFKDVLIEELSDDIPIPFELSDLNANPTKRLFDVDNDTHVSMLCELNEPFSTIYESFMSKGLLLNTTNQQWKSIDAGLVFNFTTKKEEFMDYIDIGVYKEVHEKAILKCPEATHVIVGIHYGVTLIVKVSCNLQIMDEPEDGRRAIKVY